MRSLRLPSFVASSDIIEASALRQAMRLRETWRLWREAVPFVLDTTLAGVIDAMLAAASPVELDTPRLRNWVTISKGLAHAYRSGSFVDTSYTCQYRIDSFNPDRLGELHTLRLWEGLVDALYSPFECDTDWCSVPLPPDVCFATFGRLKLPNMERRARWKFVANRSQRHIFVEGNESMTLLLGSRGCALGVPATWSHEAAIGVGTSDRILSIPATCDDFATPYRGSGPIVNDHAACEQWRPCLADAIALVENAGPEIREDCLLFVHAALPLFSGSRERFGSQSPEESEGLTYLPGATSLANLAECFVHEAMHVKLFHVEALLPLFQSDSPADDGYYSPWRPDPRPLRMLLHGCYVFTFVAFIWQQWAQSAGANLPDRDTCCRNAFKRACEVLAGLAALRQFARMTPIGERLVHEISDAACEVTTASPVTVEVRKAVTAAIEKHRQHHLKASKCSDPITF